VPDRPEPSGVTQVFLSYAREDVEAAQALAEALAADGHRVWWDRSLGGGMDFAAEIERQLAAARVVLVLWSGASVKSGFVRDESTRARDNGKLLPVRIDDVALPLGFGSLHTLDLIDWDGDADDDACQALRDEVRRQLSSEARAPQPLPARTALRSLRQRWYTPAAILVAVATIATAGWLWVAHQDDLRTEALAREAALRLAQQQREDERQAEELVDAGLKCGDAAAPAVSASSVGNQCALDLFVRALAKKPNLARAYYYLAQEYLRLYQLEQASGRDGEHLLNGARESLLAAGRQQPGLDEVKRATAERQLAAIVELAQPEAPALSGSMRVVTAPAAAAAPVPVVGSVVELPTAATSAEIPSGGGATSAAPTAPVPPASSAPPAAAPPPAAAVLAGATPAADVPVGRLMRTAPSAHQLRLAQAQAEALLGEQSDARLAAASALTLDTTLAADTLPLVLRRTLDALAAQPEAPDTREAVAQSLRLLRSASPALQRELARGAMRIVDAGRQFGGTTAVAAADVQARLARARDTEPFVFVQIGDEAQRALAERVVARLAAMGYSAPGIENVGSARLPAHTEVRAQGTSDPALGRWMAQHLGKLTRAEVPLVTLRRAQPKTDTYEIWLDKELCLTRKVPACDGA
jgi:hypothetical protein